MKCPKCGYEDGPGVRRAASRANMRAGSQRYWDERRQTWASILAGECPEVSTLSEAAIYNRWASKAGLKLDYQQVEQHRFRVFVDKRE